MKVAWTVEPDLGATAGIDEERTTNAPLLSLPLPPAPWGSYPSSWGMFLAIFDPFIKMHIQVQNNPSSFVELFVVQRHHPDYSAI